MEQEVGISVQGEARAIWEVGGAVGMVSDATWIPPFHPDQTTLYMHGLIYTRGW